jgi:hypothetical protein
MTLRAVILGLAGAGLLCGVTFFNDMVMRGTFLVGNFLPVTVFGGLVVFLLLVDPVLRRLRRGTALSAGELSVVVALVLFACYVPGRGLMHQFTTFLMLPHHYAKTTPGWRGQAAAIAPEQVSDPARLRRLLSECLASGRDEWRELRLAVPPALLETLAASPADGPPSPEERRQIVEGLNALIDSPAAAAAVRRSQVPLPAYARALRASRQTLSTEDCRELTRAFLDVAFEGALAPRLPAVLRHVPPGLLAEPTAGSEASGTEAVDGFVNGIAVGDEPIAVAAVPWSAWGRTLGFWLPLIVSVCLASTGLALVIHRQWASHERLPYPTVEFAAALLPGPDGRCGAVFRRRLFWLGAGAVLLVHLNNYAYTWWPEYLVPVRTDIHFIPVLRLFPVYHRCGLAVWQMFNPTLYFTVIGFAYFLSSDISLSLGVAPYVFGAFTGWLAGYGIAITGQMLQPAPSNFLYAGAYCGLFVVLVYSGRRYYGTVFRRCLCLPAQDTVELSAVWGARVFLVAMGLCVAQLMAVGLHWSFAVLYMAVLTILLVSASRLVAEAGVFYLHSYFFPCAVLWGFLGAKTIGPDQMLIMAMLSSVLLIDPREAFMPFAVSGLQLAEQSRCRPGRLAACGTAALVIGLAVAVPVTLYLQYQHGAIRSGDGWTTGAVPRFAFDASSQVRQALSAQGALPVVDGPAPWSRLGAITAIPSSLVAFTLTFALVVLCTFCRHRFAWWPLHPLLFLVLGTWQSCCLAFSFLLGWLAKICVTKYGGAALYTRLRPLMIGLIAGEMLGGIVPMIVGAVYYAYTGNPPRVFAVFR